MNITVTIEFSYTNSIRYEIRKIMYEMKELGESYKLNIRDSRYYTGNIKLGKDSYGYKELIKLFKNEIKKSEDMRYGCIEKVNLTKKEKEGIEYFWLKPSFGKWYTFSEYAQYFGTKYQSKCSCHLKQKPISLLYAPTKMINNKLDICEMQTGIIVSDKLRSLIEEAKCTGVEFEKDIANFKTKEVDSELNRLIITNILPPMSENTENIVEELCEKCGNVNSKIRGKTPIYDRKDLEGANDFNLARESHLVNSNYNQRWNSKEHEMWEIEEQYYIVSRKVLELLNKNGIKNFLVSPILYTDMLENIKPNTQIFHNKKIQIEGVGEFLYHNEHYLDTKIDVELFDRKYNIWFTMEYEEQKRNLTKKSSIEYLMESCRRFVLFLKNKKVEVEKHIFQEYQKEHTYEGYIEVNRVRELLKVIELKEIVAHSSFSDGPYFKLLFECSWSDMFFEVRIKENEFYVDTYEKE